MWAKPLGLLYMASYLRRRGVRVLLWDAMARREGLRKARLPVQRDYGTGKYYRTPIEKPSPLKHIPKTYARYGLGPDALQGYLDTIETPDAVLVTSLMTYWYRGVFEAIELIKETFPHVPVFLGGIYASLCSEHALNNSGADYVLSGSGEKHLSYIIKTVLGNEQQEIDSDNHLIYPAFHMLPRLDYLCLGTSRGCPYSCHYCASRRLSDRFIQREPSDVVEEIGYWHTRYGIRDIAFYDDALLVNPETHIVPILERIIAKGWGLRFHTPNGLHIREISPEIAALMYRSGFKTIRLGFESADPGWHRQTGGKVRPGDFEYALHNLFTAGFKSEHIGVYILVGMPNQSVAEAEATIRQVKLSGACCFLAEYSPIPHTTLWDEALATSPYDLLNEPLFHNNSILACGGGEFTFDTLRHLKRMREEN